MTFGFHDFSVSSIIISIRNMMIIIIITVMGGCRTGRFALEGLSVLTMGIFRKTNQ